MSEQSPWISVRERLPEVGGSATFMGGLPSAAVLCLFPDSTEHPPGLGIQPCYYVEYDEGRGDWFYPIDSRGGLDRCGSHGGDLPTHWMPLPKAPDPT